MQRRFVGNWLARLASCMVFHAAAAKLRVLAASLEARTFGGNYGWGSDRHSQDSREPIIDQVLVSAELPRRFLRGSFGVMLRTVQGRPR